MSSSSVIMTELELKKNTRKARARSTARNQTTERKEKLEVNVKAKMENNSGTDFDDPDFFTNIKGNIEKELSDLKKIVDNVNQMRVEAAYLESDLMMLISASSWQDIALLIGLSSTSMFNDDLKREND